MKTLYFIRHGQSEANLAGVWPQLDTPLTQTGKEQARQAGRSAKTQGIMPNSIIASPLPRARETAELAAAEMGYPVEAIVYWDILVERDFGELTNAVMKDFLETHSYKEINNMPGAETVPALQTRAAKALDQLQARPEDTIIVVGHGAFGRALLRVIHGQPPEAEYEPDFAARTLPNASVTKCIP